MVKFPAENNNEKKHKDDDESDSDQNYGIVDKHPVCKNIFWAMVNASNTSDIPWIRILFGNLEKSPFEISKIRGGISGEGGN